MGTLGTLYPTCVPTHLVRIVVRSYNTLLRT